MSDDLELVDVIVPSESIEKEANKEESQSSSNSERKGVIPTDGIADDAISVHSDEGRAEEIAVVGTKMNTKRSTPKLKANPYETCNVFSKLSWWWVGEYMKIGYKRDLTIEDSYENCRGDEATNLTNRLTKAWLYELDLEEKENEKHNRASNGKPDNKVYSRPYKFWRALFKVFYLDLLAGGTMALMEAACKLSAPIILGKLTTYFDEDTTLSKDKALLYAGIISILSFIQTILHHVLYWNFMRVGMRMRIASMGMVYNHLLKMRTADLGKMTTGHIINLVSNDVQRFDQTMVAFHFLYVGPIEAIVVLILIWPFVGPYSLCGFWLLLATVPVQFFFGKLFKKWRLKATGFTDERIRKMNEVISGMRVIKMYGWEDSFHRVVTAIRKNEIGRIANATHIKASTFAFSFASPALISYGIFVTFQLTGGLLTPASVFTTISLFNSIKLAMTVFFPMAVQGLAELNVSIGRLEEFLKSESSDESNNNNDGYVHDTTSTDIGVVFNGASSVWKVSENSEHFKRHQKLLAKKNKNSDKKRNVKSRLQKSWSRTSSRIRSMSRDSINEKKVKKEKDSSLNTKAEDGNHLDGDKELFESINISGSSTSISGSISPGPVEIDKLPDIKSGSKLGLLSSSSVTAIPVDAPPENIGDQRKLSNVKEEEEKKEDDAKINEIKVLNNVSLKVSSSELLAIVGPVGSGKSSLLMSILGELPVEKGSIGVTGKISYTSQEPWIINGTVRQNILFGLPYEEERYQRVVRACELKRDFLQFTNSDLSFLGERGINLSGGQKARISLARCVYRQADIYILDDPLSAVDAIVGRRLFDNCINGVLKGKCRILVTHQLQFISCCDLILAIEDGSNIGLGTYTELLEKGFDFSNVTEDIEENETQEVENSSKVLDALEDASSKESVLEESKKGTVVEESFMQKEVKKSGSVSFGIYKQYFLAGGKSFFFVAMISLGLAQGLVMGADYWLGRWTNQSAEEQNNRLYVYVYTGLVFGTTVASFVRAVFFLNRCLRSSQNLHNSMFACVLRTIITFFDTNSTGVVLNRFSKDIGFMDNLLPVTFFDFLSAAFLVLGSILLVAVLNPWVFTIVVPLVISFFLIRYYYLETSRDVKRLEGIARSPIYAYFNSSLQGLSIIHAFESQGEFNVEFHDRQNVHTQMWFLFLVTSRWLGFRLDCLSSLFVTATAFLSIFGKSFLDSGTVGLSLTYALQMQGLFQWCVRQSAEVENLMTSAERVLEYTTLEQDMDPEGEEAYVQQMPPNWPDKGGIKFKNVSFRYSPDLPKVLDSLNLQISPGEKIGIVGRTGAGKSTIMTTLFRLLPIDQENVNDGIEIDDFDISKVGTKLLRKNISVIPQDPVLFSGTIRSNIDPFSQYTDERLWSALSEVQLVPYIQQMGMGLESNVQESGNNLSIGQRQLLCLCRAILGNNKILIMDEATANVDVATDNLIQMTIRSRFKDCTVLTIAHRLGTIIDSDKIIVLDFGRVVEFDTPQNLMNIPDGFFNTLVSETKLANNNNNNGTSGNN